MVKTKAPAAPSHGVGALTQQRDPRSTGFGTLQGNSQRLKLVASNTYWECRHHVSAAGSRGAAVQGCHGLKWLQVGMRAASDPGSEPVSSPAPQTPAQIGVPEAGHSAPTRQGLNDSAQFPKLKSSLRR